MEGSSYAARFFYIDVAGRVKVKDSAALSADATDLYSLQISAHDSAFPQMKAFTFVTIRVDRNPNAPRWTANSYTFNITDRFANIIL